MCRFRTRNIIYILPVLLIALNANADGNKRDTSLDAEMLLADMPVVYSASKKAQKVSDAASAVTIITEEEIRASGAPTIIDLLRNAPGMDIIQQNRATQNASIRGFNEQSSNKLLVMIDGQSIYRDIFGGVFWNQVPVAISRIKRIEIVRGPGAALYGANAFNGVINIITKTPEDLIKANENLTLRTQIGSLNTQFTELQASAGSAKDIMVSVSGMHNHTDGFGLRKPGSVRDSYTLPVESLDIEKKLKRSSLRFTATNSDAISDYAQNIVASDARFHDTLLNLNYNESSAKNPVQMRLSTNTYRTNGGSKTYEDDQITQLEIQQQRALSRKHSIVYGGSYQSLSSLSVLTGPKRIQQTLAALFFQDDIKINNKTNLFVGARFDEHSQYGSNTSPRVSLVHHLPSQQTVRLAYGTAFRAPTIINSDLDTTALLPGGIPLHYIGNKKVRPETVSSFELGYRKDWKKGSFSANGYYNQVHDQIESVPTSFYPAPFPPGIPSEISQKNGNGAHASGIELEGSFKFAPRWTSQINYSYQNVSYNSFNFFRQTLTPKHQLNFSVRTDNSKRLEAYLSAHFVGSALVNNQGAQLLVKSHFDVDTRLGYRFGTARRPWTASVVVTNLLNSSFLEYPDESTHGQAPQVAHNRRVVYFMLTGKM